MMKHNLEEIPEKFHILFNSDWNEGNESQMTAIHRSQMNELYLEYNKYQIKKSIQQEKNMKEFENVIGGFDKLKSFT